MLRLRSMMEDVAERLFGRFLPHVEAKATCGQWIVTNECCPPGQGNVCYLDPCDGGPRQWGCTGAPHCWI